MSAIEGKPENICSQRAFLSLTQLRRDALCVLRWTPSLLRPIKMTISFRLAFERSNILKF